MDVLSTRTVDRKEILKGLTMYKLMRSLVLLPYLLLTCKLAWGLLVEAQFGGLTLNQSTQGQL